eukprot:m.66315 g.66315  ORF g.66315 m.66315 type:complete len:619 (-) comp11797_c0_seq1:99-1955(-)
MADIDDEAFGFDGFEDDTIGEVVSDLEGFGELHESPDSGEGDFENFEVEEDEEEEPDIPISPVKKKEKTKRSESDDLEKPSWKQDKPAGNSLDRHKKQPKSPAGSLERNGNHHVIDDTGERNDHEREKKKGKPGNKTKSPLNSLERNKDRPATKPEELNGHHKLEADDLLDPKKLLNGNHKLDADTNKPKSPHGSLERKVKKETTNGHHKLDANNLLEKLSNNNGHKKKSKGDRSAPVSPRSSPKLGRKGSPQTTSPRTSPKVGRKAKSPQPSPSTSPLVPRKQQQPGDKSLPTSPLSPKQVNNGPRVGDAGKRPRPPPNVNGVQPNGVHPGVHRPPPAAMITQAWACNLSKQVTQISQPFVAGVDMTTSEHFDVSGKALRRMHFNSRMIHPGSFKLEIRDGDFGSGNCLASEADLFAPAEFQKIVVDLEDQPQLITGKVYFIHISLQRGGFKFQAAKGTRYPRYAMLDESGRWRRTDLTYVMKPVYQKAVPRRGDRSGWLLVKVTVLGGKSKKISLRKADKELRKFCVLQGTNLQFFANTSSSSAQQTIKLKDCSSIDVKPGAIDSNDFVMVVKSEEFNFSATSAVACRKWVFALTAAKKSINTSEFSGADNAKMLF